MKPGSSISAVPVATQKARMDWPDVAKGLSILGVVFLHVSMVVPEGEDSFLAQLNHFLDPLRMPLFFLVSGFFSVKVLNFTFEQLFKRRLWFFLVPYLFWTPIELFFNRVEGFIFNGFEMPDAFYYVNKVVQSTSMYWFLFFLVWFNLVLWATRKLPVWLVFTSALVVPWLFMPMFGDNEILRKTLIYLPAFLIGAYFRPLITRFADAAGRPKAVVVAVAFYVAGLAISALEDLLRTREPGDYQMWFIALKNDVATLLGGDLSPFSMGHLPGMLIRVLSLPAGVVLAVWLTKLPPVARLLRFMGSHTLVIYLGHALGLTILFGYTLKWEHMVIDNDSTNPMQWTGTWLFIAFFLALAGSYLMYLISKVPVLGWTLLPPKLPESGQPITGKRPEAPLVASPQSISMKN